MHLLPRTITLDALVDVPALRAEAIRAYPVIHAPVEIDDPPPRRATSKERWTALTIGAILSFLIVTGAAIWLSSKPTNEFLLIIALTITGPVLAGAIGFGILAIRSEGRAWEHQERLVAQSRARLEASEAEARQQIERERHFERLVHAAIPRALSATGHEVLQFRRDTYRGQDKWTALYGKFGLAQRSGSELHITPLTEIIASAVHERRYEASRAASQGHPPPNVSRARGAVGGAIVGALVAGPAGAVVGAVAGREMGDPAPRGGHVAPGPSAWVVTIVTKDGDVVLDTDSHSEALRLQAFFHQLGKA